VNASDVAADYVGTASYAANGYGFIALVCSLITGTATFSEKIVKDIGCCDDDSPYGWWDDESNSGTYNYTLYSGWYGPGYTGVIGETDDDGTQVAGGTSGATGYFIPYYDQFNPYPFYNIVGGEAYSGQPLGKPYYSFDLPDSGNEDEGWDQNESPYNPQAALTTHGQNNPSGNNHISAASDF
jgi:hypothetical protein